MSQKSWVRDVKDMHEKFSGLREWVAAMEPSVRREFWEFRVRFLEEELEELRTAESADDAVDAIIDLCVVAIGTLDAFSVDARRAWDVVHQANMLKEPGSNPSRPNRFGLPDLVKPEGWVPPSHAGNVGLVPVGVS